MSQPEQVYDNLSSLLNPLSLTGRHRATSEISDGLKRIRRVLLTEGIPEVPGRPSLRPRIWKLMLKVDTLNAEDYLRWVSMGASSDSHKIKNDTFRTLATDTQFKGKVKEDMLIRLLEAFVWKITSSESEDQGQPFKYVQGMNVLSAPFLYAMPSQLEAFACFSTFIENGCPQYVQPSLKGVHEGLKKVSLTAHDATIQLLDRCLEIVDPELYDKLASKNLKAEIYAFPYAAEWSRKSTSNHADSHTSFLLAFGLHLNVLCVIAQLLLIRQELMDSPSPMKILRTFPPLDARPVIGVTVALVKDIPEELYRELVAHPYAL